MNLIETTAEVIIALHSPHFDPHTVVSIRYFNYYYKYKK